MRIFANSPMFIYNPGRVGNGNERGVATGTMIPIASQTFIPGSFAAAVAELHIAWPSLTLRRAKETA
jgi:hypothetical protein